MTTKKDEKFEEKITNLLDGIGDFTKYISILYFVGAVLSTILIFIIIGQGPIRDGEIVLLFLIILTIINFVYSNFLRKAGKAAKIASITERPQKAKNATVISLNYIRKYFVLLAIVMSFSTFFGFLYFLSNV